MPKRTNTPHGKPTKSPRKSGEARNDGNRAGFQSNNSNQHVNDSGTPNVGKPRDLRAEVINKVRSKRLSAALEITHPEKIAALIALREATPGNSAKTQEARVLSALRLGSLMTYEGRRYLDVYDMCARVMALRRAGHVIETIWVRTQTECGRTHRIGKYVLMRGQPVPIARQAPLFSGAAAAIGACNG